MQQSRNYDTILGLDVGERRIGVARVQLDALFPQPLTTLDKPETFLEDIARLCKQENSGAVVVGLPRGMSGQETAQTEIVREFGQKLADKLPIPIHWTDEAVTSEQAEAELKQRGKLYDKADIDSLAATYILEDYLRDHPGGGIDG